jgi:hypothetical protein
LLEFCGTATTAKAGIVDHLHGVKAAVPTVDAGIFVVLVNVVVGVTLGGTGGTE